MPAHNTMASGAIVDQPTSLFLKYNMQIVGQVKQLYAMLEAATMTVPAWFKKRECEVRSPTIY
jgi:hypothetical protein